MCMPTACRRPLVKCVFSRGWLASTQLPGCGWLFVSPSGPDRPADAAAAPALPVGGRGSGPRARSPGKAGSRGRSERRRGSANHGAGRAGGAPRAELMSRPPRAATGVPPPAHAAPPHRLRAAAHVHRGRRARCPPRPLSLWTGTGWGDTGGQRFFFLRRLAVAAGGPW